VPQTYSPEGAETAEVYAAHVTPTASQAPVSQAGPRQPSAMVRAEIEDALRNDDSMLGEIFRELESGKTLATVRHEVGDYAWNYERAIRALRDGDMPGAPWVIRGVQRPFRRLLREGTSLSDDARALLNANLSYLEERFTELVKVPETTKEVEEARRATKAAEAQERSGIYVYALPHYLLYPYDPASGHTLFKVGRSDRDAIRRFREQTRTTALPEDPVLLRIYECGSEDTLPREREFHNLLEAADHSRSNARSGGTEWFLTSLRFLDTIAKTFGLKVNNVQEADESIAAAVE
jgi:hypothetical protein